PGREAAPPVGRGGRARGEAIAPNSLRRRMSSQRTALTTGVRRIVAARAAMTASRAAAGVLVPIYLAKVGFSGLHLGLLFGAVALVSAALATAIGLLADRVGRKPFLVALPLTTAGAAMGFALTRNAGILLALAAVGTFGRGAGAGPGIPGPYYPAEQALVTDLTAPAERNRAFARLGSASALGSLIGGLLAALPRLGRLAGLGALAAYRPAFLAAAAAAAVAGLIVVPVADRQWGTGAATGGGGSRLRIPRRSLPLLYRLWAVNTLNGVGIGLFGPFITYWFYRRFGAGPATVGLLFALINGATVVTNLTAAGWARRLGLVRVVVVARALQALLLVPLVLAPTFWVAGGVYLLRSVVQRIGLPLRQSYTVAMAHPDERAGVAGLASVPTQLAATGTPVAGGYVFDVVGLALPFELGAFFQLANAVLFAVFFSARPPPEETGAEPAPP
ncbi:MAG TPA: MFS transporter, partial [Acidimicrobiales bacterium]|nr:MFS transporter [Acidimicrobiales bacterium]